MRPLGLIVAIVVATVDIFYVWYVAFVQSGTSDQPLRVPFVAAYLGVLAIFALFSIGLPLVVMGLLAVTALVRVIQNASRRGRAARFNRRRPGSDPGPVRGHHGY
jgi:hypothetical protein